MKHFIFSRKMKHKWKMMATISLFLKLLILELVEGKIDCHYCGIEDTCILPHIATSNSKIKCDNSCMKFDGKDPGGKRVVVRSCGQQNSTKCFLREEWNKAVGEICFCNSMNCNFSFPSQLANPFIVLIMLITICCFN